MAYDEQHFERVIKEVQRHLEDTEVSKLAHWHAAAVYHKRHKFYVGLPASCLSIIVTWLLSIRLDTALLSGQGLALFATQASITLSLIVSILTGLGTFLNFNDLATRHRTAAENLHALWRDCKNWETDFPDHSFCEKAVQAVQQCRKRLNDINRDSPQIPKWAWKSVRVQQEEGSTSYKVDEATGN
ncbi:MAG: SLATT domain-containing protein [Acidobacteriota bacterium]